MVVKLATTVDLSMCLLGLRCPSRQGDSGCLGVRVVDSTATIRPRNAQMQDVLGEPQHHGTHMEHCFLPSRHSEILRAEDCSGRGLLV